MGCGGVWWGEVGVGCGWVGLGVVWYLNCKHAVVSHGVSVVSHVSMSVSLIADLEYIVSKLSLGCPVSYRSIGVRCLNCQHMMLSCFVQRCRCRLLARGPVLGRFRGRMTMLSVGPYT